MNVTTVNPTKPCRRRKFTDEQLVELHSHGLSIPKLAKQLGVSQGPVRIRMKNLGLKANCKRGGVPGYERVGTEDFRCAGCRKVKPVRQRHGRKCWRCTYEKCVGTREGALRRRFTMKRCHARRKGIPFTLTFEGFKELYDSQAGKDGYTGQQMAFDFGHGRSGATVSLDRIDNEKGYTPDNVVFCRLDTNAKKSDRPRDQFMGQVSLQFPEAIDTAEIGGLLNRGAWRAILPLSPS
jgi:hypothetical protein